MAVSPSAVPHKARYGRDICARKRLTGRTQAQQPSADQPLSAAKSGASFQDGMGRVFETRRRRRAYDSLPRDSALACGLDWGIRIHGSHLRLQALPSIRAACGSPQHSTPAIPRLRRSCVRGCVRIPLSVWEATRASRHSTLFPCQTTRLHRLRPCWGTCRWEAVGGSDGKSFACRRRGFHLPGWKALFEEGKPCLVKESIPVP